MCHSSYHASRTRFSLTQKGLQKSGQQEHELPTLNLASTPNPDSKYGAYIYGRLSGKNATSSELAEDSPALVIGLPIAALTDQASPANTSLFGGSAQDIGELLQKFRPEGSGRVALGTIGPGDPALTRQFFELPCSL